MIDHAEMNTDFGDIEEMVRAAGGYLEVSDDLRPRTLEEARASNRETATRSGIAGVVVVIVFLAMFASQVSSPSPVQASISANGDQLYAPTGQTTAQANVDLSWSLVDAFSALRQRQASLIEDAF